MKGVSLFAGIGGLDLGFERAGGKTILQVERDQFCQKVLARHWPNVRRISDVHDVTAADCEGADVLFGGFPCQPVSLAGKREGQKDERWLWPEFKRLIGDVRPRYAVMENVPGLVSLGLAGVLGDLAALGYDADWTIIPAASVGAPHRRERIFIVAHSHGRGLAQQSERYGESQARVETSFWRDVERCDSDVPDTAGVDGEARDRLDPRRSGRAPLPTRGLSGLGVDRGWERTGEWNAGEPAVGRVAHGVPGAVDRLTALGNAVVPQVAEYVFRRLFEFDAEVKVVVRG